MNQIPRPPEPEGAVPREREEAEQIYAEARSRGLVASTIFLAPRALARSMTCRCTTAATSVRFY